MHWTDFSAAGVAPVVAVMGGPLLDWTGLIWAFALLTGWVMLCHWMALDVPWVGADKNLWWGIAMGVGTLGLVSLMILPTVVSLPFWTLLVGGQTAAYTLYRNAIVPAHLKVLTPEWFAGLFKPTSRVSTYNDGKKVDKAPVDIKWMDGPSQMFDPPEDPDFRQGFDRASRLIFDAVNRRTTDLTVAPSSAERDKYGVNLVIDGFNTAEKPLDKTSAGNLLLWMKKAAGLDLSEHRKPQKGKVGVIVGKKRVDLLVMTRGSVAGEEMTVRVMDRTTIRRIGDLGLAADNLEKFKGVVQLQRGMFVVGGPAQSGLTTTLYALLREHDLFQFNVASIEDPVYMDIENATQVEYNSEGGKTSFGKAAQNFFRAKDPDVLMLGRSDPDTLQFAATAAERKKVYLALECTSAVEGLGKVIKAVGDGELVTRSLVGVSCQKLVRVLCPECKVAYKPSPDALKRLNVSPDKVSELFRPPTTDEVPGQGSGCPKCQGTGYFGQTGAFELLVLTDPIRKLVASGSPLKDIQNEARKDRMLYLHEQILRKVIDGTTSVQELMRVMQSGPAH